MPVREIDASVIREKVAELCSEATHKLPEDVEAGLRRAAQTEKGPLAKQIIVELLENVEFARSNMVPLCQDTGTTVVFVELGQDVHVVGGSLEDAINEGVGKGYTEGYLRASVVAVSF